MWLKIEIDDVVHLFHAGVRTRSWNTYARAGLTAQSGQATLWQIAATSGSVGAYTTFSTYMYETPDCWSAAPWWEVAWNLAALAVGVGAVSVGWAVGTLVA